jgi:hypothetical protein
MGLCRDRRRRWLRALLQVGLATVELGDDGKSKTGGKIIPNAIVHDFRRGAIRNLSRAGVSEAVAMQLCGHETGGGVPPLPDRYRRRPARGRGEAQRRKPRDGQSFGQSRCGSANGALLSMRE